MHINICFLGCIEYYSSLVYLKPISDKFDLKKKKNNKKIIIIIKNILIIKKKKK